MSTPPVVCVPAAVGFTRGQVNLLRVLRIAKEHEGKTAGMLEAFRSEYLTDKAARKTTPEARLEQQQKLARNIRTGMINYRLLGEDDRLTPLAEQLLNEPEERRRYERFAAHILWDLKGIVVIEAVRNVKARALPVTKETLAEDLSNKGVRTHQGKHLTGSFTAPMELLNWLKMAGVVGDRYEVDPARFRQVLGVADETMQEIARLDPAQRDFLRVLKEMREHRGDEFIPVRAVKDVCVQRFRTRFREDQIKQTITGPLAAQGWVEWSGPKSEGRGAKSGDVRPAPKLTALNARYLDYQPSDAIPAEVREKLNTPLEVILSQLADGAQSTHIRGIALEVLTVRLAYDVGLTPVRFRERHVDTTGGGEVDLIAEGGHLHFSRWLFQCKNTPKGVVGLSALAKEIGMAVLLRAHVIVLVTTGKFASTVDEFARSLAQTTPHQVILIDRTVLNQYRDQGAVALLDHFRSVAANTMHMKRSQLQSTPDTQAEAGMPTP